MNSKLFTLSFFTLIAACSSAQYTKLHDFETATSGYAPYFATPITDGTYLYGTCSGGGVNYDGTIYRIKKDGTDFTKIFDFFEDETGFQPKSAVILIGEYLYGTTEYGGTFGNGTVYRIKTDGTDFSTIANFETAVTGGNSKGALFYDGTYLYGVNPSGGANNSGTIFKLLPDGSEFTVIFHFLMDLTTGRSPYGHLITDGEFFYGLTVGGGASSFGVVFKINMDGTGYQNLLEFNDDPYGTNGYGSLVYDGIEYMYAFTNTGGEYNRGTIFKIKTDGSGYVKLRDFNNDDGAQPMGTLTLVDNVLYGMTELAGSDAKGNMFSMNTDGTGFTTLIDFDGLNGSLPFAGLLYDSGAFFGMTASGGVNDSGVIFRYGELGNAVSESTLPALSIFPNPTQDYFTIQTSPNSIIDIFNGAGELVKSMQATSNSTSVITKDFAKGLYVVKVLSGPEVETASFIVE